MQSSLRLLGALVLVAGCGNDAGCIIPPCVLPEAINAKVVDKSTGAPIKVHVDVTGRMVGSQDCDSVCRIPGPAGTYHLAVSAAGYAASTTDVTVSDTKPSAACGCEQVSTQVVTIALAKTS